MAVVPVEIAAAGCEASPYDVFWNVVPALPDAFGRAKKNRLTWYPASFHSRMWRR